MKNRNRNFLTAAICALLVVAAMMLSLSATYTKSSTADEPLHLMGAYTHAYLHDYRIDTEDPPLWQWVPILAVRKSDLKLSTNAGWDATFDDYPRWQEFADDTFFKINADAYPDLINRARTPMVLITGALIALAIAIAWRLAGRTAAIATGLLLALDPLFLGHGSLIKNDVAISILFLAATASTLAVMRKATPWRCVLWLLVVSLAPTVKFTGVIVLPLMVAALLLRAITSERWLIFQMWVEGRLRRIAFIVVLAIAGTATTFGAIWAAYDFRFSPVPNSTQTFNRNWFLVNLGVRRIMAETGRSPTQIDAKEYRFDLMTKFTLWAIDHHALPDAFCIGFLHTRGFSLFRQAFLLGKFSTTGWWYYFPLAMLFKTPTATIVAFVLTIVCVGASRPIRRRLWNDDRLFHALIAGGVVACAYMATVMSSNLNLGVRHVMPVYPLLYIAIGVVFSITCRTLKRKRVKWIGAIIAIGLAAETLSTWPNYIAFFNAPSGGTRGGIRLLSDSNLDWGQDLTGVAEWQAAHPNERLYVASFGPADPAVYGIQYLNMPGGYWNKVASAIQPPCVLAVSADDLQGLYIPAEVGANYIALLKNPPRELIGGGAMYLFDIPPR